MLQVCARGQTVHFNLKGACTFVAREQISKTILSYNDLSEFYENDQFQAQG